jgi:hypothetical protein
VDAPGRNVEELVAIAKITLMERYLRSKLEVAFSPRKKAEYRRKIQECFDDAEKL